MTAISFFDMSVNITPPGGYLEPIPITLGPNWQQNDFRMLFIAAAGTSNGVFLTLPLLPDPPTGLTSAFTLDVGHETFGAYYRKLITGDSDMTAAVYKPNSWGYYMFATLTARDVSPTSTPTAGRLAVSYTVGQTSATISSVTVPAAGTMVFMLGTLPDPDQGGIWPNWSVSMGCPTGWTNLVATASSGSNYFSYDNNPGLMVIGNEYTSSGTTGAVSVPIALGSPRFVGMYMFLQTAADQSVSIVGA